MNRAPLGRLKRRAEFLRIAAQGRKFSTPGLVLQAMAMGTTSTGSDNDIHVGFTCSRKVGNAVARNRARRRLQAAAREVMTDAAQSGYDYVLIGRTATIGRPYALLLQDLRTALKRVGALRDAGAEGGVAAAPSSAASSIS